MLLSALILTASPTLAQQTPPAPGQAASAEPLIDISFPGGTLQDFVTLLAQQQASIGDSTNILVSRSELIEVPPLTLKRVSVMTAVQVLQEVLGQSRVTVTRLGDGRGSSVISIGHGGTPFEADNRVTEVISLNALVSPPWLEGAPARRVLPAETVLTAIDEAVKAATKEVSASIRFHPESGLLVVTGTVQQIRAAIAVAEALSRDIRRQGEDLSVVDEVMVPLRSRRGTEVAAQLAEALAPEGGNVNVTASEDGGQVVVKGPKWSIIATRVAIRTLAAGDPEAAELREQNEMLRARLQALNGEQQRLIGEADALRRRLEGVMTENTGLRETVQRLQNTPR
jgi:hypothetical protein